jgi:hypothetical protein
MLVKGERTSQPTEQPTTSAPPSSLMLLKSERNSQPTAQPATSGTHPVADALDRTATPAE